ncbi:MAG: 4Fe-4S dicluster domain-containing protein [Campylobacteraceae bacterium]|jgi:ferredoxin|nr:4Fe-4S dicluster domain-containing protein [Campylobacteraceae bacterium]
MAVKITELCINCGACIEECPATAIVGAEDSPLGGDVTYVKPEKCIECEGSDPRCATNCPTEGAIVWDLPYIAEYNDYYMDGHKNGIYKIRENKKGETLFPAVSPKPFQAGVSIAKREKHTNVVS